MQSLAVKYRPTTFETMLGQKSTIAILKRQLEQNKIQHCYLFAGSTGCGKTTVARAFASKINEGKGEPIEIDGASNNGVDNIRDIIDDAKGRSIDSKYKIFIIDECHMITSAAWNAFLKTIEEPPAYTIFMFCTTNPEKIPATILNRVMRFNISKVPVDLIRDRLLYICKEEGYQNYEEACDFISKLGDGGVRDSIAYLEKCANYSNDLSIDNVLTCLGSYSYKDFFQLTGAILGADQEAIMTSIDNFYNSGKDLKIFVESYLEFMLDLTKYCLLKSMSSLKLPQSQESNCAKFASIPNALDFANRWTQNLLNMKNAIKYDTNSKNTITVMFIAGIRKENI